MRRPATMCFSELVMEKKTNLRNCSYLCVIKKERNTMKKLQNSQEERQKKNLLQRARLQKEIKSKEYQKGMPEEMVQEDMKMLELFHRLYASLPKNEEELWKAIEQELGAEPQVSGRATSYLMLAVKDITERMKKSEMK